MRQLPPPDEYEGYDAAQQTPGIPTSELVARALRGILKRIYFPVIFLILAIGGAIVSIKVVEPRYSSSLKILIEKNSPLSGEKAKALDRHPLANEMIWFTYKPVIEDMVTRVGLAESLGSESEHRDLVQDFIENRISVQPERGTNVIRVSTYWKTPEKAREIASTLADVFIDRYKKYNNEELVRRTAFLSRQVEDLEHVIEQTETSLTEYQKTHNILSTERGMEAIYNSLTTLEVNLGKVEFELKYMLYDKERIQTKLKTLSSPPPVNRALTQHLTTQVSPLFQKMKIAEEISAAIVVLERKQDTEDDTVNPDKLQVGGPSPVSEALRRNLVGKTFLRTQLEDIVSLERKIRSLQLEGYLPKHESVNRANAQLKDASQTARATIESFLDPKGVELFDKWGASVLLSRANTWEAVDNVRGGNLDDLQKEYDNISEEIRQIIKTFDPAGITIFDSYGPAYMLAQAIVWQSMDSNSSAQIVTLRESLAKLEHEEVLLRNRMDDIKKQIKDANQRFNELPATQAVLLGRRAELQINQDIYTSLRKDLSKAQIEVRANMWNIEVVDPPVLASTADFPKPIVFLAGGLLVGLLFGLGIPILLEFADDRFRSPSQVEKTLGLPVLATLPAIPKDTLNTF